MKKARSQITVHKLGLFNYTLDGAYYAKVDDENVGYVGRMFWQTKDQAQRCGEVNLAAKVKREVARAEPKESSNG